MFTIFPNLNSVTFTNVSITSVTTDSFTNCGKLISIYLNFNNFPTLPSAFASTCINVTSLYLMTNYIKELDNDALKGLTFLNYFYAAQNNITCIPPGLFTHTPVVQFIDLSYNQISEIDSSTFKGLANLNNINLMYNKIVNLPAFDVTNTGLTMSFMLMLGDNPIKSVSPKFITNIFTTRGGSPMSANVMLYNSQNLTTTCFPSTQYFYGTIFSSNWPTANISLGLCYSNWKAEYETTPVSCRGNAPVETTTSKNENGNGSVGGKWPFGDKNFFAIITNAMKNFTANVSFY